MTEDAQDAQAAEAYVQPDEPIRGRSQDRLGRSGLAELIADQALAVPAGRGFVIGVVGRWGSGKTSILNLVAETIGERNAAIGDEARRTIVLRFDPWLFGRTDELVARFIGELSAQLGETQSEALRDLAGRLATYGEMLAPLAWVPVLGPWAARASQTAGLLKRFKRPEAGTTPTSLLQQRKEINAVLTDLPARVVVLIDDIDRLEKEQIRDVVKLVKLVGDFPNVTYLLAYDHRLVARALADTEADGAEYLEKIVQSTHPVPEVDRRDLIRLLIDDLNSLLKGVDHGPFIDRDWQDIFLGTVGPLFRTPRDVWRFLNPLPVTLKIIGQEVALVDVLALEALRAFVPAAHALIPSLAPTLTGETQRWSAHRVPRPEEEAAITAQLDTLLEAAAPHQEQVKRILARLFPPVASYLGGSTIHGLEREARRNRRVSNHVALSIYLRRAVPSRIAPARVVVEAFQHLADAQQLDALVAGLDEDQLVDLVTRLEDFVVEAPVPNAAAAVAALLNQRHRLREGHGHGFLDVDADIALARVILRMLEQIEDEQEREQVVVDAFSEIESLSSKEALIDPVGHRENVGSKLISAELAERLYEELADLVLDASEEELAKERDLGRLLFWFLLRRRADSRDFIVKALGNDAVFLRVLRSTLTHRTRNELGSTVVDVTPMLPWDDLLDLLGEEALAERVASARATADKRALEPREREALEAAEAYVRGELPAQDF